MKPFEVILFAAVVAGLGSQARAQLIRGVDVSHYQGSIDYNAAKSDGIQYVFPKATEGVGTSDATFTSNVSGALAAGLLVGPYHFAHPDSGESSVQDPTPNPDAVNEANYFCNAIAPYYQSTSSPLMMRPVLDMETANDNAVVGFTNKQYVSKWTRDFIKQVETRLNVTPIIYTYTSFASSYLDNTLTGYDLWIANYSYAPRSGLPASAFAPWTSYKFWQYTDAATVAGISGGVDGDVFQGTMQQLGAYLPKYFAGDYNDDNIVDARDYVVWRDSFGKTVNVSTGADGDLSGVIDMADFDVWKSQFGAVKSGGGGGGLFVGAPEPGTLTLALAAAAVLVASRARRHGDSLHSGLAA